MKRILYYLIFIWIVMIFIPMFCVFGNDLNKNSGESSQKPTQNLSEAHDRNIIIKVLISQTNEIKQMRLDEYLKGVLTAEMPASYHIEALKAQAVVARSYTYNKYIKANESSNASELHNGADICTSSEHCQAYLSIEDANTKWGSTWSDAYYKKIEQAVFETDGEVLEYNNQPVNAVFHGASYGRTENAKDVWGSEVLYLKSVESKGDKTQLETQSIFSHEQFKKLMKDNYPDIILQGDVTNWIKNFKNSEGGSVLSVDVGNKTVKGSLIRTIFSLKSSNFEVITDSKNIIFNVRGAGHGVGMSQYGANAMANDHSNYKEILMWYYKGTNISYWGKQ